MSLPDDDDQSGVTLEPMADGKFRARLALVRDVVDEEPIPLTIPDTSELSLFDAATAYATAGLFLLPTAPADCKNPGSIVGGKWQDKSSNDLEQVRRWWSDYPGAGIAWDPGRSGAIVFDLDEERNNKPANMSDELWSALQVGAVQSTRRTGIGKDARAHYIFACKPDEFGNSAGPFRRWGDVKCSNGVVVLAPTPHPDAKTKGGQYHWRKVGQLSPIPDVLRALLRTAGRNEDPKTPGDLVEFLRSYDRDESPKSLQGQLTKFASDVESGASRHDSMTAVLVWAFRESMIGCYSAQRAYDQLRAAFTAAKPDQGSGEFDRIARWAAAQAEIADPDETRRRKNREPAKMAKMAKISRAPSGSVLDRFERDCGAGSARRNAPLDLYRLRSEPPTPVTWIWPDVIPTDSYVSLSAAPGTGKSILARGIAVDAVQGRSHTDPSGSVEPMRILYLDAENGQDWWREGLDAMDAPLMLPNLAVICYPDLAGLDTARGAREFHELVARTSDELDGVDLVVLDTVSRFIEAGENDADTWSQFYRLAIAPLREQRIAVLRLDHLGKDADRGPRGSSHKLSDVDADYRLTATKAGSNNLTLTLGKRRRQHFVEIVKLRRLDHPLRHEPSTNVVLNLSTRSSSGIAIPANADVAALVTDLDSLGIDPTCGRDSARAAYLSAGGSLKASNAIWTAALKFRRDHPPNSPKGG